MPIRQLAEHTQTLGRPGAVTPVAAIEGPPEVQELAGAVERLTGRIQLLLARERESVADLSHRLRTPVTALRLRVETVDDPALRDRLAGDLDALQATVDEIVREARRSEREGLDPRTDAVAVVAERVRHWEPLAEDQGRAYDLHLAASGPLLRASRADLEALVDVLLDNVFSHTPDDAAVTHHAGRRPTTWSSSSWRTPVPGCPPASTRRVAARAAPGRPAWASPSPRAPPRTPAAAITTGASDMGGARVAVTLRTD